MRLFSKKTEKDGGKKKCKYCDMIFEDDERLRRHTRKAHSEKTVICQILTHLEHNLFFLFYFIY